MNTSMNERDNKLISKDNTKNTLDINKTFKNNIIVIFLFKKL